MYLHLDKICSEPDTLHLDLKMIKGLTYAHSRSCLVLS